MTGGVLDPEVVRQLRDDLPPDVFLTIVVTFEADARRLSAELGRASRTDDAITFRRAAHTLAGAAGAVGAAELEDTARRGMAAADAADRSAVEAVLHAQVGSALAALRALAAG
jgi:HPt (histidine-containing phosphotransfer) domain-containing protein